jgi:hypothetical protein
MKIIISEEQLRQIIESRYLKSTPKLRETINKYLDDYVSNGTRKIGKKSRSYGNLNEEWCIDGKEMISARYQFMDDKFDSGLLLVPEKLVNNIQSIFGVKESFVLYVIEEWYEDVMIPKFEEIVGETGLSIKKIYQRDKIHDCIPEPVKPEGITDEEMIDFIVNNTLYRRPEVIKRIESGQRDLEDFYLDIVDTVEHKKQRGF